MVDTLPVVFRTERHGPFAGTVTAVFPTLPSNTMPDMVCYAHVGQHGSCSIGWYSGTRPAYGDEYAPLLAELRSIYERSDDPDRVQLLVCQRTTPQMFAERRAALGRRRATA